MVVAYIRVSTTRQHLENQQGEINNYALRHNLIVDRWITDTVSGTIDHCNRKLGGALKKLKWGDTLIVTEVSRLSRSLHDIMTIMKLCVENNIVIHSTKDGFVFDDSINSKVMSFAFGLAAEIEHKLISQRTKEAMAIRRAEGKHMGRVKGSGHKIAILYEKKDLLVELLQSVELSMEEIAQQIGVSTKTIYRFGHENPDIELQIKQRSKNRKA